MSVAVQHSAEKAAEMPSVGLAVASLFGTLYVLIGWALINHVIPILFWLPESPPHLITHGMAATTIMVGLMLIAAVGMVLGFPVVFGSRPGLKAGVALGVFLLLLGALFIFWTWNLAKYFFPEAGAFAGGILPLCVGFLWASYCLKIFRAPTFEARMERWEDNGWFTWKTFKHGQGLKARRATMLGLIAVAAWGIWTYFEKRHLAVTGTPLPWATYWAWRVPYSDGFVFPVVIWPNITVPLLLLALVLWIAFRVVNYPQFADFLIATEAEMNKVSWASGKRLYQDTIVVLVTVLMMAIFLYIVDSLLVVILKFLGIMKFG